MHGPCTTKSPSTSSSPDSGLGHEANEPQNESSNSSAPTTSTNNNDSSATVAALAAAVAASMSNDTAPQPPGITSFSNPSSLPWPWLNSGTSNPRTTGEKLFYSKNIYSFKKILTMFSLDKPASKNMFDFDLVRIRFHKRILENHIRSELV